MSLLQPLWVGYDALNKWFVANPYQQIVIVFNIMEQVLRPYFFIYTDHDFYFKTTSNVFNSKEYIRINRLTSKIYRLTETTFEDETRQISAKFCQEVHLIVGVVTVLQEPFLCLVTKAQPVGTFMGDRVYQVKTTKFIPFKHRFLYNSVDQTETEKILESMREDLLVDNFYYCYKEDITITHDKKFMNSKIPTERKYFWNEDLLKIFARQKLPLCWRIPIMQGFVREIHSKNANFSFYYLNVSRRSKYMSGTRFNSRGIDHSFNASNFVETQEIFMCHNLLFSHVSLRGSAPIFWEQSGFGADIKFSKEKEEENEVIIKKHFDLLEAQYGGNVVAVNLLSRVKSPQKELKNRFQFYYYKAVKGNYLFFDFNEEIKEKENGQKIIEQFVSTNIELLVGKGNFFCIERGSNKIICRQKLIPRINCLDCIDRTNVIMTRISELFLKEVEFFLNSHTNTPQKKLKLSDKYFQSLLHIWSELGDRISRIYCGTQSVASHLTKKENNSFLSFFSSGLKSINRYYNANMSDAAKQQCLDYFLCNKEEKSSAMSYFQDNITAQVLEEVKYCTYEEFGVYAVTWNCNMVEPDNFKPKDVEKLLNFSRKDVDIIVICLQQMVELNSYNVILGNNDSITNTWRKALWNQINQNNEGSNSKRYDFLTGEDLVGIATFVFVNDALIDRITQLQWFQIKTGFKNSLGNKGATILFLKIDSTPITIINCHLAAGESKANERTQDIQYIHRQAIKERSLRRFFDNSEFRFFIGDMNFRLEGKNEEVRQMLYMIEKQDQQSKMSKNQMGVYLQPLLQKDQYHLNKGSGSLASYSEAEIYFMPTYKYLKKEKGYDTKRTPSWCDRILFYRKEKLKLVPLKYSDVDVYLSDHKPVAGLFRILCKTEDLDRKKRLIQIYFES